MMETEVVRYLLRQEKGKRAVLARLVLYCAPFLKRLKISAMIWMPEVLSEELESLVNEMGVFCERLDRKRGEVLIFLYREEELSRYLMRAKQEAFLLNCGYRKGSLQEKIRQFAERISREKEKGTFPQEAGIFLGYPFEDVEGFAGNSGKECVLSGYWKVYGHRGEKEMLFALYDQMKVWAVNEFLAGKTAGEICRERTRQKVLDFD